jgi:Holliday junction resolvase RusA-like endonuclease
MSTLSFTLYGEPASKSNSRRLVQIGGRPRFIKSKKALSYVKAIQLQANALRLPMFEKGVDLSITMHIFYASRRPDLDESVILDALQQIVYHNDRSIKEKHIYWGLDKVEPRCEITLREISVADSSPARAKGRPVSSAHIRQA